MPAAASSARVRRLWLPTLLTLLSIYSLGQPAAPSPTIASGETVSGELGIGKKTSWTFTAEAGQSVSGRASQVGTDLIIRVIAEKDRWTSEHDRQLRYEGSEAFGFVADQTGAYRIEIEVKRGAPAGRFSLTVDPPQAAGEKDRKLHEASILVGRAAAHARAAKYADGIADLEAALKLREEVLGGDHPDVAFVLNRIGIYHASMGNSAKAFDYQTRALQTFERTPGHDELLMIEVLNNVAVGLRLQGDFASAEKAWKRIIAIREGIFGTDSYTLGPILNNLGLLYRVRGDHAAAQQYYERSLAVREKFVGDMDLDLQFPLTNMAALAYYRGDLATALKIDQRVLDIRRKNLPPDHPLIAQALQGLGLVTANTGDLAGGERLLLESIAIAERSTKPDSMERLTSYFALGNLYREQGNLKAARDYIDRGLKISAVHLKSEPLQHAAGKLWSARLRLLENDPAGAETDLGESLAIREKMLGPDHSDVREVLVTMARLQASRGDVSKAADLQARANKIGEKQLAVNLIFGTEYQRLAFAELLRKDLEQTLAMHAFLAPADERLRDMSAEVLVQRKGRVLDAMALSLSTLRRRFGPEEEALFSQLNDVTARLSSLMISGQRGGSSEKYERDIAELRAAKEKLDQELSRKSAGYYQPAAPFSLAQVKEAIPAGAALVEFAVARPVLDTADRPTAEPEYVAYVLRKDQPTGYVRLGNAAKIDAAAAAFRRAVRDPMQRNASKLGRDLDELVFRPIRSLAGGSTHVIVSPEGELNVLPFEALVNEAGQYAVERFKFTYLTSGRDLFRLGSPATAAGEPMIVADPLFGPDGTVASLSRERAVTGKNVMRSVTTGKDISEVHFGPLRASALEAESIKREFPEATLLTGSSATVDAIRGVKAPRMLHLATHGFFLEDPAPKREEPKAMGLLSAVKPTESPLVRSGLAFAGANLRRDGPDDGLLTALEATGLNLWGTKLVVLSACDTGLGEIRNGEGVYGLRRSFALAGAESVVMSLWPVSDQVSREIMTGYYQNLKKGLGRGEALRQVRLQMLKRPNRKHPFYWASFIQSGEWANLDGKR